MTSRRVPIALKEFDEHGTFEADEPTDANAPDTVGLQPGIERPRRDCQEHGSLTDGEERLPEPETVRLLHGASPSRTNPAVVLLDGGLLRGCSGDPRTPNLTGRPGTTLMLQQLEPIENA